MAYFESNHKQVYYEVYGTGDPIVILNGIMMSTLSWQAFINAFSHNQLILVDFFDQGKSERLEGESYKLDLQVEVVNDLLEHLNLSQVNLVGISYGGEVAISFAVKYQVKINKLILFNTAAYTSPWIEDIGHGWKKTAKTYDAEAFTNVTIPVIYSPEFYNHHIEWMKQRAIILNKVFTSTFLDAMVRLINSAEGYDCRNYLTNIEVPTLIVGAENDYLTPLPEQKYLHEQIKNSQLVIIPRCGHASMYEKPTLFISLINGFVNSNLNVNIL